MPDKIRVLIADDHAVVREGLKLLLDLEEDITVVGEASDGRDAVEKAGALAPDVVLMDLVMPGMDGVEATRAVKEVRPEIKVLVLTSFADDDRMVPALAAGATGYLMKDTMPEALVDAVRTVHRGDSALHPQVARRLIEQLSQSAREPEGTVTILFSDMEGFTEMTERLGDQEARRVIVEYAAFVREQAADHGGLEIEVQGDGFLLAFGSARRALECAVDIQRASAWYSEAHAERPVRLHIGVHTGEVIREKDHLFGKALILASRIAGKAASGEILASEVTRTLAGEGFAFRDRGEFRLKGLAGTHRLFELPWAPA